METKKENRILARVVAKELTDEQLDDTSGGWGRPWIRDATANPSSSSINTSTQKRNDPWMPDADTDGGADD